MKSKGLGISEERKLWKEYKKNGTLSARETLIINYAPLVKYIASRMSLGMPSSVEVDDLVSYGIMGLIDAIEKFEPERGFKFKTYASQRIRGAILDEIRQLDWVPRSVRKKARDVENAYRRIERRVGRAATDLEVTNELEISLSEFHELLTEISGTVLLSLDNVFTVGKEDDEINVYEAIEAPESNRPNEVAERSAMLDILTDAIEDLPEKERLVLTLYYYEEMNLKEIGAILGVTESRVSQIHTKAVMRLRIKLSEHKTDFIEELGK